MGNKIPLKLNSSTGVTRGPTVADGDLTAPYGADLNPGLLAI